MIIQFSRQNSSRLCHIDLAFAVLSSCSWKQVGAGWVISSEIQPLETRCLGQGVTVFMSMINSAIIGQCFLTMLCTMEYGVYILFSVCQLGGAVFCIFFLPETKGKASTQDVGMHGCKVSVSSRKFEKH